MRLITRKVHRAFPVLDHFTDEQCGRVVQQARGGRVRRFVVLGLRLMAAGAACLMMLMAIMWARTLARRPSITGELVALADPTWLYLVVFFLAISAAGFGYLLSGDLTLHLLLRQVLRRVALCARCKYPLAGLPVVDGAWVRCPECASENTIDGGDAVAVGTDGLPRYLPATTAPTIREGPPDTAKRRGALLVALASFALLAVVIAANEAILRIQSFQIEAWLSNSAALEGQSDEMQARDSALDAGTASLERNADGTPLASPAGSKGAALKQANEANRPQEQWSSMYVIADMTSIRLEPSADAPGTRTLYRGEEVMAYEERGGWVRISEWKDGRNTGYRGRIAEWAVGAALGIKPPPPPKPLADDARISMLPRVAGNGLSEYDTLVLRAAALYRLESGKAKQVISGGRQPDGRRLYFLNFGEAEEYLFMTGDIPGLDRRIVDLRN